MLKYIEIGLKRPDSLELQNWLSCPRRLWLILPIQERCASFAKAWPPWNPNKFPKSFPAILALGEGGTAGRFQSSDRCGTPSHMAPEASDRQRWSAQKCCRFWFCFHFLLVPSIDSLGSQVFTKNYTECYAKHCNHRTAKSVQLFMNSKLWRFLANKDQTNGGWHAVLIANMPKGLAIFSALVLCSTGSWCLAAFVIVIVYSVLLFDLIISEPIFSWNHLQQARKLRLRHQRAESDTTNQIPRISERISSMGCWWVGGWGTISVPCFPVLVPFFAFQCSWPPPDSGSWLVCVGSDSWFPIRLPPFNKQLPVARFEHFGTVRFQSRSRRLPFGQASAVQNMSNIFFVARQLVWQLANFCSLWCSKSYVDIWLQLITCEQDEHVTSNGVLRCLYVMCMSCVCRIL